MIKISLHVEGCDLFDDDHATSIIDRIFDYAALVTMEQGAQTVSVFAEDEDADEALVHVQQAIEEHIPNARVVKVAKTPIVE